MAKPWLSMLEAEFWPAGGGRRAAWMIADGARDRRVYPCLLASHLGHSCLYSGPLAPELELAAPYLVQLEPDDRETRQLVEQAWGNSWGVFLQCDSPVEQLRRHLRGLLIVKDDAGKQLAFRYYDPRVLRVFLPTCAAKELETLFGPVTRFILEEAGGAAAGVFQFDGANLVRRQVVLAPC